MVVIGIDPGLSGGIGWIDADGIAHATPMPILDKRPDLYRLSGLLLDVRPDLTLKNSRRAE